MENMTRTYHEDQPGYGVRTITEVRNSDGSRTMTALIPQHTEGHLLHFGMEQEYRTVVTIIDSPAEMERQRSMRRDLSRRIQDAKRRRAEDQYRLTASDRLLDVVMGSR